MFGRTREKAQETPAESLERLGGKGHATPTRKQAQAAAKARARGSVDKKTARAQRAASQQRVREGMRRGEEKYLLERDKGPVKRFVRDYVDSRISFMEFLLPVLVVIMALQFTNNPTLQNISSRVWTAAVILLLVDVALLMFGLGKQIKRRFPDGAGGGTRGWRFYALMRSIQLRVLRLPKPQRKIRETLPERY